MKEHSENGDGGDADLSMKVVLWQWFLICLAVYLVRILPWCVAELWYDEIITLGDFAIGPRDSGMLHVFRSYPVANNHILFSAVAWWWVRFTDFTSAEYLLRLPSIVFGGLSIGLILVLWRRFLGDRGAYLAAMVMAISQVFGGFAYQFRGYSLTMLLTVPAVAGLMELSRGNIRRGLWLQLPPLVLLPLVIPSNAILALAHAVFLLVWTHGPLRARKRLAMAGLVAGAGALGLAYYGTILDQFLRVARQTSGWPSGMMVLGSLGLGLGIHLGLLVGIVPAALVSMRRRHEVDLDAAWAGLYIGALVVPVCATLLVRHGNAPFPRVYLAILVPVTFAVVLASRNWPHWERLPLLVWAAAILVFGYAAEWVSSAHTRQALRSGEHPQNLVQQYYRGSTSLRALAQPFAAMTGLQTFVITDAYDFPTFRFYWTQQGLPGERVMAENRDPEVLWRRARHMPGAVLCAIATDELQAARLFAAAGETGSFQRGGQIGDRSYWVQSPNEPR